MCWTMFVSPPNLTLNLALGFQLLHLFVHYRRIQFYNTIAQQFMTVMPCDMCRSSIKHITIETHKYYRVSDNKTRTVQIFQI